MSAWSVEWNEDAEDGLAAAYLNAADRAAVTQAQDRIDRLLAANPLGQGTPVSEGLYRLTVPPLSVAFTVDQAGRSVQVTGVSFVP
jgi:hypothetical protein